MDVFLRGRRNAGTARPALTIEGNVAADSTHEPHQHVEPGCSALGRTENAAGRNIRPGFSRGSKRLVEGRFWGRFREEMKIG